MTDDQTTAILKDMLSGAQLPALPQSAIRLLELSQDPENGPNEFAAPIETDPGLTGQVLRFVNSSYFGFSREISSVKLAINLVGSRTIKNFALWSAVFSLMPNPKCGPFDLKGLWQDSLRRGLFARAAGKFVGLKASEDLFAAALLQDMAIPLLAKELNEEYIALLEGRNDGRTRLSELEREKFGWTHAEAAGVMARGWSLPEEFAIYIEGHSSLVAGVPQSDAEMGAFAVALSAMLPSANDPHWWEKDAFVAAFETASPDNPPKIGEVLSQIDAEFEEFAPVLKVATPKKALVDFLNEEVSAEA